MKNYSTKNALLDLKITGNHLSEKNKNDLNDKGYCIIYKTKEQWMNLGIDIDLISNVVDELIEKESWRGGWDNIKHLMKKGQHPEQGAQRLNNLLRKNECFRNVFTIPETLEASNLLIKSDIALSQIILRMPLPGKGDQPWHVDWIPRRNKNDQIKSVLSSLLLDDFSKENGATRILPGSHKFLKAPSEEGYHFQDHPNQKYIEAPKGSLLIYDINLWHRGSTCLNGKKRRHLNINYRERKIWQQINFKKELPDSLKEKFSVAEKYLLKIRDEDPDRNEWLFKHRNNFFVKKTMNFIWNLKK